MTQEEARNRMMDYLFDEMDDQQKKEFEAFLKGDAALQKELEVLRQTSHIMAQAPPALPPHKLVMIPPGQEQKTGTQASRGLVSRLHPAVKTVFAIAASVLIILFGSALAGLHLGQTEAGFYIGFGEPPAQTETGISEEEVALLIDQLRNENVLLIESLLEHIDSRQTAQIERVQAQQNEQMEEVLHMLTDYYEQQRQQDIRMISEGFAQLQQETNYRFMRTGEALEDLIYAMSRPGQ